MFFITFTSFEPTPNTEAGYVVLLVELSKEGSVSA